MRSWTCGRYGPDKRRRMAKPLDRFAILVMSALCVAWGGNQVAAKSRSPISDR